MNWRTWIERPLARLLDIAAYAVVFRHRDEFEVPETSEPRIALQLARAIKGAHRDHRRHPSAGRADGDAHRHHL